MGVSAAHKLISKAWPVLIVGVVLTNIVWGALNGIETDVNPFWVVTCGLAVVVYYIYQKKLTKS